MGFRQSSLFSHSVNGICQGFLGTYSDDQNSGRGTRSQKILLHRDTNEPDISRRGTASRVADNQGPVLSIVHVNVINHVPVRVDKISQRLDVGCDDGVETVRLKQLHELILDVRSIELALVFIVDLRVDIGLSTGVESTTVGLDQGWEL